MSFEWTKGDTTSQVGIRRLRAREKKQRKTQEKMAGWDKGGHGIYQHDDPGSYTDSTYKTEQPGEGS